LTSSVRVPATKRFSASDATLATRAMWENASGEGAGEEGATGERRHRGPIGDHTMAEDFRDRI